MLPFLVQAAQVIAANQLEKNPEILKSVKKVLDQHLESEEAAKKQAEEIKRKEEEAKKQNALRHARFELLSFGLGHRIEQVRKLKGWSLDECAEAAGISRTALRNVETGQDSKLSTVVAISEALSMPLTSLLQGLQNELETKFEETLKKTS